MAYNNLSVQDYCNMIENFINNKFTRTFTCRFTELELYMHCINNTEHLDSNDEKEIGTLVHEAIGALIRNGIVEYSGKKFCVVRCIYKDDCIRIFSPIPRITKVNQGIIDTLKGIDERTSYFNDPTAKPIVPDEEKTL